MRRSRSTDYVNAKQWRETTSSVWSSGSFVARDASPWRYTWWCGRNKLCFSKISAAICARELCKLHLQQRAADPILIWLGYMSSLLLSPRIPVRIYRESQSRHASFVKLNKQVCRFVCVHVHVCVCVWHVPVFNYLKSQISRRDRSGITTLLSTEISKQVFNLRNTCYSVVWVCTKKKTKTKKQFNTLL